MRARAFFFGWLVATLAVGSASAFSQDGAADAELVKRGEYLAKAGDCAGCHTVPQGGAPFAGGLGMGSPFGTIMTSNITPDMQFGIGEYSYEEFVKALREGVARDGKHLYPAMPYPSFSKISDDDMRALYAYFMHGVQPVHKAAPPTKLPFPFSQRWALVFWNLAFTREGLYKPSPEHDAQWNRGAYLMQSLGHCGACHTPRGPAYEERGYDQSSKHYLTGGVNDHWFAPNLTGDPGSGLGRVRQHEIVAFLKGGHGGGLVTFGSMVQVVEDSTQYMSDDDLNAIAVYLKSLQAQNPSGAYAPHSRAASLTATAMHTGEVARPGSGIFMSYCAKCHQADGAGVANKYPKLAGNPAVLAADTTSLIRLVVEGGSSPETHDGPECKKMPAFAQKLTTTEIAQVLTFIRTTWGNNARPVSTRDVQTLRADIHK
ncbi:c-type cytochrome [Caballeronia humi]|uniref:Alcohol dehydrogenase cytochrome c subunit n=1 Tax=Caballeronia humi TaxID=326474 RepID=A0A158JI40_9BURK|nr:cytochrome c [Caballeronia humi]SAL68020.1 alcohol dehydrogenase cytochrome c subunit [Caballeronia humi]